MLPVAQQLAPLAAFVVERITGTSSSSHSCMAGATRPGVY